MTGEGAGEAEGGAAITGLRVLPPEEMRARMQAAARGEGVLEIITRRILDLHRSEVAEGLTCHEDECDDCALRDGHTETCCTECFGTDDGMWTHVTYPCPTIQAVADALRVYPDQQVPTAARGIQ